MTNFTAIQRVHVANYEPGFSGPAYRFVPDPTSADSSPALFANWSVPEETTYCASLRRRSAATVANTLRLTDPFSLFTLRSLFRSRDPMLRNINPSTRRALL